MNLMKFQRKAVGWLVLCSFRLAGTSARRRCAAKKTAGIEKEAVTASSASGGQLEPGMIEKENPAGQTVAKKKFPWLLVAAVGAVAVGVAVYFLFIKKPNYTLTVTLGDGVSGTPGNGAYIHKKGTAIAYDYSLQPFFKDLVVSLDGMAVAASGTITMDKDHTLTVSSQVGLH